MGKNQLVYSDAPPHAPVVFSRKATLATIRREIEALHTSDKAAEVKKKKFTHWSMGLIGGAVLTLVVGAMLAGVTGLPIPFLAFPLFIAGAITLILRSRAGRCDVDDRKLDVVRAILDTLGPEMHLKRPVGINLDFHGYHRSKPVSKNLSWGSGTRVFAKRWLHLSFCLLDGTAVAVHATSHVKRKSKAKRKYTKVKDRIVDEIDIYFKLGQGRQLEPDDAAARIRAAIPAATGLTIRAVSGKPRGAHVSLRTAPAMRFSGRGGWSQRDLTRLADGPKVVRALIGAYRGLSGARV